MDETLIADLSAWLIQAGLAGMAETGIVMNSATAASPPGCRSAGFTC
jgi:hypothetical protein